MKTTDNTTCGLAPLETAKRALDSLIRIGSRYDGLWPDCMDLDTHEVWKRLEDLPPAIPGQRACDRSPGGCNLMHDIPALGLAYRLAELLKREDYRLGADRYLNTFLKHARTETGLFPWGEHSWMDLETGAMGDGYLVPIYFGKQTNWTDGLPRAVYHDHLRQAPAWFWEKVGSMNASAVQRFADGLDRQWRTEERTEYSRHGALSRNMWYGISADSISFDFPRHSGFYILDLACAYAQQPREETMRQLWRYADYWWNRRRAGHCLPSKSRSAESDTEHYRMFAPPQTLSLAASLHESAEILNSVDKQAAVELFRRASVLAESALDAPHAPEKGIFAALYRGDEKEVSISMRFLGSVYGVHPAATFALLCCAFSNWGYGRRYFDMALALARLCVREIEEKAYLADPQSRVPAMDLGQALGFLCDVHAMTGERSWLDAAMTLWKDAGAGMFVNGLPKAATGAHWYEAQQGSAYFLQGAARLGLLIESNGQTDIGGDYSAR